ncbi:MAG: hypothetical protein ACYTGH_18720 [Planctomycetota bacterium]
MKNRGEVAGRIQGEELEPIERELFRDEIQMMSANRWRGGHWVTSALSSS